VILQLERTTTAHARIDFPAGKSNQSERKNRQYPTDDFRKQPGLHRTKLDGHVFLTKQLRQLMLRGSNRNRRYYPRTVGFSNGQSLALDGDSDRAASVSEVIELGIVDRLYR
jgi:hypothetical protein